MVIKKFVKQLFGIVLDLICPAGKHEIDKQNPCKKTQSLSLLFRQEFVSYSIQWLSRNKKCGETMCVSPRSVWRSELVFTVTHIYFTISYA